MFAADSHKTQQACAESSIINIPLAEWIVGTRRRPGDDLNHFFWVLIFIWSRTSWRACWAAPGARVRCGSWWTQEVVEVSPINRGPEPTPGSSREGSVFKKLITLLTADRIKGTVCHFCRSQSQQMKSISGLFTSWSCRCRLESDAEFFRGRVDRLKIYTRNIKTSFLCLWRIIRCFWCSHHLR